MDFSVFNTRRQSSISPPWCIIYYYRNKIDVAERGGGGPGANVPVGGLGISPSPPPSAGAEPLSGGFSAARRGTIKCNFTAAP